MATTFEKKVTKVFAEAYGIHPIYSVEHAKYLERIIESTNGDVEAITDYFFGTFPSSYGLGVAQEAARRLLH